MGIMHGHKLPDKAIALKDLTIIKKLDISYNPLELVKFTDNGIPDQIGYLKRIKGTYSDSLAKMCVATSAEISTTGVAEERLVYDENGKLAGTLSTELPGFIAFQNAKQEDLKDLKQQALACPTPEMILEEGFIEKMVACLLRSNDDFGPHNCGLKWLLDFELFFPEVTTIFKGKRFDIEILGYKLILDPIETVIELTADIIRTFKTKLTYFPGEEPKNGVKKREFKTTAFKELLENKKYSPEAIRQRYAALLRELLVFDPKLIKKRLDDYLGDEKLNLAHLAKNQKDALIKLEQTHLREKKIVYLKDLNIPFEKLSESNQKILLNFEVELSEEKLMSLLETIPLDFEKMSLTQQTNLNSFRERSIYFPKLLYNENNKERSFADFFLTLISHRHEKFRRVFIEMPELRDHLLNLQTPQQFASVFHPTTKHKMPDKYPEEIFSRYQTVWRDAFRLPLLNYIDNLKEIASQEVGFCKVILPKKEKIVDLSLSCALIDDFLPYIKQSQGLKDEIHEALGDLVEKIYKNYQTHYALKAPTFEKNQDFIKTLLNLLQLAENKKSYYEELISKKKMKSFELNEILKIFEKLNTTIKNFKQTLLTMQMNLKISKKMSLMPPSIPVPAMKEKKDELSEEEEEGELISMQDKKESILATNDEKLIERLISVLQIWIPCTTKLEFDPIIKTAREEYAAGKYFYNIFSRTLPAIFSITDIFSDGGGWENNSMNTLLIKNICLKASGTTILNTVLTEKNKDWWAEHAKELAIACNLCQPKKQYGLSKSAIY